MKLSFSKIVFFSTLLFSTAFAGGIEEDNGPEEVSVGSNNDTNWNEENFPELIEEYVNLAHGSECFVVYSGGYVNDPDRVTWPCK